MFYQSDMGLRLFIVVRDLRQWEHDVYEESWHHSSMYVSVFSAF